MSALKANNEFNSTAHMHIQLLGTRVILQGYVLSVRIRFHVDFVAEVRWSFKHISDEIWRSQYRVYLREKFHIF